MDGIYEVSSSEKVRSLEEDLKKELKELQNEVEEGNFLSSVPKAFGWAFRKFYKKFYILLAGLYTVNIVLIYLLIDLCDRTAMDVEMFAVWQFWQFCLITINSHVRGH